MAKRKSKRIEERKIYRLFEFLLVEFRSAVLLQREYLGDIFKSAQ